MTYIIKPSIFYWISVLNGLKTVLALFLALSSMGLLMLLVNRLIDGAPYDDESKQVYSVGLKVALPVFVLCLLGIIFLPGKQTMIEMLVAKTATVDNAEWTVDALKSVVDYIVEAAKAVK